LSFVQYVPSAKILVLHSQNGEQKKNVIKKKEITTVLEACSKNSGEARADACLTSADGNEICPETYIWTDKTDNDAAKCEAVEFSCKQSDVTPLDYACQCNEGSSTNDCAKNKYCRVVADKAYGECKDTPKDCSGTNGTIALIAACNCGTTCNVGQYCWYGLKDDKMCSTSKQPKACDTSGKKLPKECVCKEKLCGTIANKFQCTTSGGCAVHTASGSGSSSSAAIGMATTLLLTAANVL